MRRKQELMGFRFPRIGKFFNDFYSQILPFPLTGAQKRVIREIRADVDTGRQMNRLVQGDVGSGKTIVALMAMLMALDNGCRLPDGSNRDSCHPALRIAARAGRPDRHKRSATHGLHA